MQHLVLLGDSIFDNASYTDGGPAVISHVQQQLPAEWRASLGAIDGSVTTDIPGQLTAVPADATHLVLSVGGNDAILRAEILDTPVSSSSEALLLLSEAALTFERSYQLAVEACLGRNLPLIVCTIYHGAFPDPNYQKRVVVALTLFNDVILRLALHRNLKVIDLRSVCTSSIDYANPIEPSVVGGAKIARAIVQAVTEPGPPRRGTHVVAV